MQGQWGFESYLGSLKDEEAVPNVPVIACPSLFSSTARTL